ncbi:hypothetical protein PCASD_13577 [Puccinia coronata f. sp. avenae]|uniref:Golgi apparatus membrane protein TVP38 n=1 Tax=Puccinia coronata f. sp. avenae TaxID=200324 RepID=A0A2N5TDV2_9BASI|nr:hypothetical protein PCASD_13577 [Puccinia coronata f. sp. avenae]
MAYHSGQQHPSAHYPPQTIYNNTTHSNLSTSHPDNHSLHDAKGLPIEHASLASHESSFRHKTFHTAFGPLSLNHFLRKDWIKYYVLLLILLILIGIVTIYHHQIVIALHPFVQSMRDLKINGVEVGWLIPVAVLFIISFPPLFGHEIVIILCGLVWGLWLGFAIVSVGTLLGELANYWTFKYACSHRAAKLEKKDVNYACMCVVVREGGFWIAFLARLSAIPGHLVTPVFATTGMSLFIFTAATVLSMPKQLAGVYLGTLFTTDGDGATTQEGSRAVKYSVIGVTFVVTIVAALYIYKKMAQARAQVELGQPTPLAESRSPRASHSFPAHLHTSHPHSPTPRDTHHLPSHQMKASHPHSPSSTPISLLENHHHHRVQMDLPPSPASSDPSNPFADHLGSPPLPSPSAYPLSPHDWPSQPPPPHALSDPFVDPAYYAPLPPSDDAFPPASIPYSIPDRSRGRS